jgi:hypothetical protein
LIGNIASHPYKAAKPRASKDICQPSTSRKLAKRPMKTNGRLLNIYATKFVHGNVLTALSITTIVNVCLATGAFGTLAIAILKIITFKFC